jgi:aromatic ring-opening dioxygenase catalytic subunit (LigB family)
VGCSVSNDLIKKIISPGVVVHTFSPNAQEAEADGWISEFKASLVYKMSSRTARATTQRNLVSGRKKKKEKENKFLTGAPSPLNFS